MSNPTAEKAVARPYTRKVKLFTRGKEPAIDALKICYDLLTELPEHQRLANLNFIADKFGYVLMRKSRW